MGKKLTEVASRLASRGAAERQIIYIVDFENIPKTDVAALLRKKHVVMVVLAANRTNTVTPETLKTIEANPDRVDVIIGRITRKEFVDKLVTAKIGEYAFRFPQAEIIVLANDKDYADLAGHLNDHWEREVPIVHVSPGTRAPVQSRQASASASPGRSRRARKPKEIASPAPEPLPAPSPAEKEPEPEKPRRARSRRSETTADSKTSSGRRRAAQREREEPAGEPPRVTITNPDAESVRALLANVPKRRLPRSESALLNAVRNYRESVGLRSRPSTIIKHLEERGIVDLSRSPIGYALDG